MVVGRPQPAVGSHLSAEGTAPPFAVALRLLRPHPAAPLLRYAPNPPAAAGLPDTFP